MLQHQKTMVLSIFHTCVPFAGRCESLLFVPILLEAYFGQISSLHSNQRSHEINTWNKHTLPELQKAICFLHIELYILRQFTVQKGRFYRFWTDNWLLDVQNLFFPPGKNYGKNRFLPCGKNRLSKTANPGFESKFVKLITNQNFQNVFRILIKNVLIHR